MYSKWIVFRKILRNSCNLEMSALFLCFTISWRGPVWWHFCKLITIDSEPSAVIDIKSVTSWQGRWAFIHFYVNSLFAKIQTNLVNVLCCGKLCDVMNWVQLHRAHKQKVWANPSRKPVKDRTHNMVFWLVTLLSKICLCLATFCMELVPSMMHFW